MSLFYYMASSHELPTGSFGMKCTTMTLIDYVTHVNPEAKNHGHMKTLLESDPKGERLMENYETNEDAAGLYVRGPMQDQETSLIFRFPYVYEVHPDGGSFEMNEEIKNASPTAYTCGKKCLTELFHYLDRNLRNGEEIELFSCWTDGLERFTEKEVQRLEPDLILEIAELLQAEAFEWKRQQYIVVKK
ncbi:hypothetical protein [Paenibacillus sp. KS-LC4]|uniref:hypothetical protein n=1 Tax=Paenibacillus sp. KS-LC4 TaxID=2979727 RepID=UPI0030CC4B1E